MLIRLSAIDKNSTISARVCARESQGRVYKKFINANGIPQKKIYNYIRMISSKFGLKKIAAGDFPQLSNTTNPLQKPISGVRMSSNVKKTACGGPYYVLLQCHDSVLFYFLGDLFHSF